VESGTTCTSISGVFAPEDPTDDICQQTVSLVGMGCMAARDA
jgi:thioredoxin reductase